MHEVLKHSQQGIKDIDDLLTMNEIFMARCQNIGNFSAEQAIAYGLSGPMLRASGVTVGPAQGRAVLASTRSSSSTSPSATTATCTIATWCASRRCASRSSIIEQALEQLPPEGPIVPEKMPRRLRTPPGEVYSKVESPRGEWGVYLVSKGGDKPYRLKMRSPSFCNLSALRDMTIGQYLADAVMILGSMDIVLCDVDR